MLCRVMWCDGDQSEVFTRPFDNSEEHREIGIVSFPKINIAHRKLESRAQPREKKVAQDKIRREKVQ
jgi:hypothetical protein